MKIRIYIYKIKYVLLCGKDNKKDLNVVLFQVDDIILEKKEKIRIVSWEDMKIESNKNFCNNEVILQDVVEVEIFFRFLYIRMNFIINFGYCLMLCFNFDFLSVRIILFYYKILVLVEFVYV